MHALLQNLHLELWSYPEHKIVCFRRTEERLKDLQVAEASYTEALAILDSLDRSQHKLLLDIRNAPLRNDPSFQDFVARFRVRMFSGFAKTAILVRTAVGELQMNRLGKENSDAFGEHRKVCRDEQEALDYLSQT